MMFLSCFTMQHCGGLLGVCNMIVGHLDISFFFAVFLLPRLSFLMYVCIIQLLMK